MLYLLPVQDLPSFKFGFTTKRDLYRVAGLHGDWNFNLPESYIVTAVDDSITKLLERDLKTYYKNFKYDMPYGDGYTEFLDIRVMQSVLDHINDLSKLEHLGLTIQKGIDFKKLEKSINKKLRKERHSEKYLYNQYFRDYIYETIDLILESKYKFYYHEQENDEVVVGYLISKDSKFLEKQYYTNFNRIFPNKQGIYDLDKSNEVVYFNPVKNLKDGYAYLRTREVHKKVIAKHNNTESPLEKHDHLVNAQIKYFQKVCRRELAAVPEELLK